MGLVCIRNGCLLIVACALIQKTPSASGLMYLHRECALGVGMRKLLVKIAAPSGRRPPSSYPAAATTPCHRPAAAVTPCHPAAAGSQPPSGCRPPVAGGSQRPQAHRGRRIPATPDFQRLQARTTAAACSRRPHPIPAIQRPPLLAIQRPQAPSLPVAAGSEWPQTPSGHNLQVTAGSQRPKTPSGYRLEWLRPHAPGGRNHSAPPSGRSPAARHAQAGETLSAHANL